MRTTLKGESVGAVRQPLFGGSSDSVYYRTNSISLVSNRFLGGIEKVSDKKMSI